MGHPFYLLAMVNLYCINDSTRDIDLPTRFDNISPRYNKGIFQNVFRDTFFVLFPEKDRFKGQTSPILSTTLYTYPPL